MANFPAQGSFLWQRDSGSPSENASDELFTIGNVLPGAKRECTFLFHAPSEPTDCIVNVVIKYTLESDTLTEIRKTLPLDIPVIQLFHTTFDILPQLGRESDMPDMF